MTNEQLYLAIGVPIILNTIFNSILIGFFWSHMNTRFEDMKSLWRAEMKNMNDILDARLKHLEEKR